MFSGKTILAVEDIEINRELLRLMLEETGVKIDFAKDGKAALDIFCENPEKYDLILMDIHMPEMDGYETTKEIRNLEGKGRKIPIIAMTANVLADDIVKCLDAGMNDHIGKPVKQEDLIEKIMVQLAY